MKANETVNNLFTNPQDSDMNKTNGDKSKSEKNSEKTEQKKTIPVSNSWAVPPQY